ncbi:hypothetical protein ACIBL8_26690 [Streptomyces sp. NPDC050523]
MREEETGHGASVVWRYVTPRPPVMRSVMLAAAVVVVVAALWATAVGR